jgi:hypothetical protein
MEQVSGAGKAEAIATDLPQSAFWDTDIPPDWSTEFKPGEYEKLAAWYANGHGFGDLHFDPFVPFAKKLRPDTLKRYRLFLDAVGRGYGLDDRVRAIIPLALHYYFVERYPLGIRYALNGMRRMGISKAEISDIFALAWLHTGPPVINELAADFGDYMDMWAPDWDPDDRSPGFEWGDGWNVDPAAFECGIDFSVPHGNELLPGELALIEDWHQRVEGDVPPYVKFSAKYYPLQLLTFRARYEQTVRGHLPKQFIALARLQLAALWHQPMAARRALHMARHFAVPRDQAIHALGHAMLYGADIGMDPTFEAIDDILDDWPAK